MSAFYIQLQLDGIEYRYKELLSANAIEDHPAFKLGYLVTTYNQLKEVHFGSPTAWQQILNQLEDQIAELTAEWNDIIEKN